MPSKQYSDFVKGKEDSLEIPLTRRGEDKFKGQGIVPEFSQVSDSKTATYLNTVLHVERPRRANYQAPLFVGADQFQKSGFDLSQLTNVIQGVGEIGQTVSSLLPTMGQFMPSGGSNASQGATVAPMPNFMPQPAPRYSF